MVPLRLGSNDLSSISGREIFFDTNVLLFLFSNVPPSLPYQKREYSALFKRLLAKKNPLFVDIIVVSEFINAWFGDEYKKAVVNGFSGNRKAFRDSADGRQILKEIYHETKAVLDQFQLTSQSWNKPDIVDQLTIDNCDFNDKFIIKICQNKKLVLLTDDKDFASAPIDILTINKKLLDAS